jgi:hypothetical protein
MNQIECIPFVRPLPHKFYDSILVLSQPTFIVIRLATGLSRGKQLPAHARTSGRSYRGKHPALRYFVLRHFAFQGPQDLFRATG